MVREAAVMEVQNVEKLVERIEVECPGRSWEILGEWGADNMCLDFGKKFLYNLV